MKKQNTKTKIQKVFPVIFVASAFLQACGGGGSSGGGAPMAGDLEANPVCAADVSIPTNFFQEIDSATSLPVPDDENPSLRYRYVRADMNALKEALRSKSPRVRLDLFNDKAVDVIVETIQKQSEQNFIMTGRIANDELSSVSLVVNDDVVVANVHPTSGARYTISYHGEGNHSIQEIEDHDHENCESEASPIVAAALGKAAEEAAQSVEPENEAMNENNAVASVPRVDMLVAYTPGARAKVGGTSAMKALIQMGIADTNRSFSNSGVSLAARLVGTMEVRQNDRNNFSADLSALRSRSDGRWDEVHAQRTRLGADQVTLVGTYSGNGTAGIGYIRAGYDKAFSIVKTSAFGIYSFTHELGHNVGLNHSDGYLNSSGRFRTIMSYGGVTRIRRFSNPNISYNGYRTGDSNQNSSSILNSRGGLFSRLTATKVPVTGSDEFVAPAQDGGVCE